MDPAFPDVVRGQEELDIDDRARVWTVTRGTNGRLEERLDTSFLSILETAQSPEEMADAMILAAGRREIADTRVW
jgi:hypothetical protein